MGDPSRVGCPPPAFCFSWPIDLQRPEESTADSIGSLHFGRTRYRPCKASPARRSLPSSFPRARGGWYSLSTVVRGIKHTSMTRLMTSLEIWLPRIPRLGG